MKASSDGHSATITDGRYAFGPFLLDAATRELWRGDQLVALTPKAFDLLRVLLTCGGRAIEKTELIRLVWPDSFVGEDSLTQNIATLRKALGDPPDRSQYIATVPRHGYRFATAVRAVSDRTDTPEALDAPRAAQRLEGTVGDSDAANAVRSTALWFALSIVAVLAATGLTLAYYRVAPSTTPGILRFVVTPPEGTTFSPAASFLALSPNGRFLAFIASRPGEETRLWVRALDSLTARQLPGTEGALGPFWSPDSEHVGFFANGMLKKVSLLGEPPVVLCEIRSLNAAGGTWHRNGVILFSQPEGIYRTSSAGGMATPVTLVDRTRGELAHVLPQFLPDGRHFVYTARIVETGGTFDSWIVLRSLDSADDRRLFIAGSQALYTDGDYLLFLRESALLAQSFDVARLQLRGEPVPVPDAEHVGFNAATSRGMFSVSQTGVLAYRPSAVAELGWFDRTGQALGWIGVAGRDYAPALSHDSRRLAVSRDDSPTATHNLWILDVGRVGVASRFTSRTAWETCPVWSPDDTRLIFARGTPGDGELYEKSSNGATEERLLPHHLKGCPLDWSRDGRYLLFYRASPEVDSPASGVWVTSLIDEGQPQRLAGTWSSGPQRPQAQISPNGRWLTYVSDATGRREVYVRSFPNGEHGTWQVSSQGGVEPQWRDDGRELFFLGADGKLMAVPVITDRLFRVGTPTALFSTALDPTGRPIAGRNQYLVTADGQRFLLNQPRPNAAPSSVTIVVNWPALLKRQSLENE